MNKGFTYIEMLITIAIVSTLFFPIMRLFSVNVLAVTASGDLITALNIARGEMERIKNLGFSEERVRQMGSARFTCAVNGVEWQVNRIMRKGSDPVEVRIAVCRLTERNKPLVELSTLIEDLR